MRVFVMDQCEIALFHIANIGVEHINVKLNLTLVTGRGHDMMVVLVDEYDGIEGRAIEPLIEILLCIIQNILNVHIFMDILLLFVDMVWCWVG